MFAAESLFHASTAPQEVWDIYTDPSLWSQWSDDIEWAEIDGTYCAGAKGRMRFRGLPETRWEVLEAEAPRHFRSQVLLPLGLGRLVFDHTLEERVGGTVIWERVDFRGPLAPLVAFKERRRWRRRWPVAAGRLSEMAYRRAQQNGGRVHV